MNVVNVVPMPLSSVPPPRTSAPHRPVLTDEIVAAVDPRSGGVYVDATVGAGGHTRALLGAGAGHVIGLDRDARALETAAEQLERLAPRVELRHARFSQLREELTSMGIDWVDGVIADVGVSSMQLAQADRGMSFRSEGPLDMRMDPTTGETAQELLERLSDDELTEVLLRLGEERRARRVARCVKQDLRAGRLETTRDLRRSVVRAVGPARVGGVDPATRTFQALRMAVNGELDELEQLVDAAADVLVPGGVVAVISFHSLEDRIVKRKLRDDGCWQPLTKKPVTPGEDELIENPRSRSAKLRAAQRLARAEDEAER
ncbi:MAG: 16S rRNA (cytosine(1402)-N(4))-methyltransferase RsmH [Deltaproteobacteria bacterium]|nr:16S rRNA (cytosine(1402)-N(4))-methyltransferase RsmH [Deltaproteobacteria bacterium]